MSPSYSTLSFKITDDNFFSYEKKETEVGEESEEEKKKEEKAAKTVVSLSEMSVILYLFIIAEWRETEEMFEIIRKQTLL